MKVYIAYGWAEGPYVAENFINQIELAGISHTRNLIDADVIFAHSAGIYFLPKDMQGKTIFANGLPWTKDSSVLKNLIKKQSVDFNEHKNSKMIGWWFKRLPRNVYYIFLHPSRTYSYYKAVKATDVKKLLNNNQLYLIYNEDDPFTDKDIVKDPNWQMVRKFYKLPGGHDNCWVNPAPYVKIITDVIK